MDRSLTVRIVIALLISILINLFYRHSLLPFLGDRSLPILSRFLGFITLFLPGFSSGNWKQKFSPPFSPSVFVCQCILKTHCPGNFFSHNFIIARCHKQLLPLPSSFLNICLSRTSVETQYFGANGLNVLLCSQDQHNYITLYLRTEENWKRGGSSSYRRECFNDC